MELKITNDEEQKLLDRRLIRARLNFSEKAVPSRKVVLEELSKQLKVDKKLIVIKEIKTVYGSTSADVDVHIYSSEEIKNKLEPEYLIKRGIEVADNKEEKKQEPKIEEPKEEPKPAEKEETVKQEVKEEKSDDKKE